MLVAILALFGAMINAVGVYGWDQSWNARYDKGIRDQRWAWDVRHLQWLSIAAGGTFFVPSLRGGPTTRVVRLWIGAEDRFGWNPPENWGTSVVRWTRLEACEERPLSQDPITVRFFARADDADRNPLKVELLDAESGKLCDAWVIEHTGEYSATLPPSADGYRLRWRVSRPMTPQTNDLRVLGVAVYDPSAVECGSITSPSSAGS